VTVDCNTVLVWFCNIPVWSVGQTVWWDCGVLSVRGSVTVRGRCGRGWVIRGLSASVVRALSHGKFP
jgi:hypothetical protein